MGKLAALSILIAVAFVVYFFNPQTQLEVSQTATPIEQDGQASDTQNSTPITSNAKPEPNAAAEISVKASHQHTDNHQDETEIPQYIKDQLESQRLPASELTVKQHPDGSSSIDLKGQFQHVPVAILGEDGKVKIVETRIEPRVEPKAE
jgi:hypothetical protein